MGRQNRSGRSRHPERDRQIKTVRTGRAVQERQNGTGRTIQAELDSINGIGRTGQAKQERQNGIGRKGQEDKTAELDRTAEQLINKTAEQGCQERMPRKDCQDRNATRTGLSGQGCPDRVARTGAARTGLLG